MGATSQLVLARAVALLGAPSINDISPKLSPADNSSNDFALALNIDLTGIDHVHLFALRAFVKNRFARFKSL